MREKKIAHDDYIKVSRLIDCAMLLVVRASLLFHVHTYLTLILFPSSVAVYAM